LESDAAFAAVAGARVNFYLVNEHKWETKRRGQRPRRKKYDRNVYDVAAVAAGAASILIRVLALSNLTLPSISANKVQSRPVPTFWPAVNLVPRCRTKMLPAVTNSPPYRLTPSLLLTLSRPLRTLP
jgi:hypothetical protein